MILRLFELLDLGAYLKTEATLVLFERLPAFPSRLIGAGPMLTSDSQVELVASDFGGCSAPLPEGSWRMLAELIDMPDRAGALSTTQRPRLSHPSCCAVVPAAEYELVDEVPEREKL